MPGGCDAQLFGSEGSGGDPLFSLLLVDTAEVCGSS